MIIGNKWFYAILSSFFVLLVMINLVFWMTQPGTAEQMATGNNTMHHPTTYISFRYLFDVLGTFPGPSLTLETLNSWANVLTNFDITGIGILDGVLAIIRIISAPVVVLVGILGDMISNLIWFFHLVFDGLNGKLDHLHTGWLYDLFH